MDNQTTVHNHTTPETRDDGTFGVVIGVIIAVLVVIFLFMYLPTLRNNDAVPTEDENPGINIDVNVPDGGTTPGGTTDGGANPAPEPGV